MTITRAFLETLTSADLTSLADEYGIDVPDGLNRRFIIGELLQVAQKESLRREQNSSKLEETEVSIPDTTSEPLPKSYNETQITALLRNPAWVFAYWDIKESDLQELQKMKEFTNFALRVMFFHEGCEDAHDSYDVQVKLTDRDQYILMPHEASAVRINLVAELRGHQARGLASSDKIVLPKGYQQATAPHLDEGISPILELSGLTQLRKHHYNIHRQSFS